MTVEGVAAVEEMYSAESCLKITVDGMAVVEEIGNAESWLEIKKLMVWRLLKRWTVWNDALRSKLRA